MAVRPTPTWTENVEHVLPAPEWSYCPDAGDEARFRMHTFVVDEVPQDTVSWDADKNLKDREEFFANLEYTSKSINTPRITHDPFFRGSNPYIGWYNWNLDDPIRDLKGPWLQTVAQTLGKANVNDNFRFGGYTVAFDVENERVDHESQNLGRYVPVLPKITSTNLIKKLNQWQNQELLCSMPAKPKQGLQDPYVLGRCYDDFTYLTRDKHTATSSRVTACEMLSHLFNPDTFHPYFATHFLGLNAADLEEIRMTELFEPLNLEIQSLKMRPQSDEEAWKKIVEARFYVNRDGSYNLGDQQNLEDLSTIRQISQQVLDAFCNHHFGASDDKFCRYLQSTGLKAPFLFQRHLLDTYRFFKDERINKQDDEQVFADRTNLQLAPCRPQSQYSSLHESGRLKQSDRPLRKPFAKDAGVENAGENCWLECGQTDGSCPQFCTNGVCCRKDRYKNDPYFPNQENANYRKADICYYANDDDLDESYHQCVALPAGVIADEAQNPRKESFLPAVDVAMDYFDRDGWCARGGSRRGLDLVPDVWLDINAKIRSTSTDRRVVFPCPVKNDGTSTDDCEHILARHTRTPTSDDDATHTYTLNEATCSLVLDLPQAVCGCLLYTSPSPRDRQKSRMPSSA